MRTYKIYRIFLVLLIASNTIQSQQTSIVGDIEINRISKAEYNNVYINGVRTSDIVNIKANKSQLDLLLSANFIYTTYDGSSLFHVFKDSSKGLYISYQDLSDVGHNPQLNSYYILNSQSNFTILGITIKVGDNIDVLGNVIKNDSEQTVTFLTDSESSYIEIKYNSRDSNRISSIKFKLI